ncbi:MAG: hypothetical protein P8Y14_25785, partial [Anaerolineales bacterium]
MSTESTHKIMTQYFSSEHSDVSMMAEDVVFTIMATGDEHKSPEGVLQMLNYFYRIAFEATAEMKNFVVADGKAVSEWD